MMKKVDSLLIFEQNLGGHRFGPLWSLESVFVVQYIHVLQFVWLWPCFYGDTCFSKSTNNPHCTNPCWNLTPMEWTSANYFMNVDCLLKPTPKHEWFIEMFGLDLSNLFYKLFWSYTTLILTHQPHHQQFHTNSLRLMTKMKWRSTWT
jgi:hypothetical protein